ncbi:hypothetical protein BST27_01675 [Mycobacterium intermedium]|uniref:Uncharacterized protein n=1 Tax=Mycobacterium intermedium TaxID=28445 RepID=A0A1E3SKH7_MYCIE|nr:hypothetical protein [Mycobacterium intermedium]MCV6962934.1 hypothetical protein [Mycobacterium intermedium]ODR02645.1 hypothetical protein BHQ20_03825 [Mycobacterium intermedium]OPE51965.1 hypothetical protein BV508_04495 [Mycobacterium intermedium]ORB10315.1 hypothetical protein BST27_01675 [Mycobacterium intermedium]
MSSISEPPRRRGRVREWIQRYLPYEITSAATELGGAAVAYITTGSLAAAAVAGTVGATVGYYAAAFLTAVRLAHRQLDRHSGMARRVVATGLALRSISVEFGPAEFIDSLTVRPATYYLIPATLGNVIAGWVAAKAISDLAFYSMAIISYEKFGTLLVRHRSTAHGGPDPPGAPGPAKAK